MTEPGLPVAAFPVIAVAWATEPGDPVAAFPLIATSMLGTTEPAEPVAATPESASERLTPSAPTTDTAPLPVIATVTSFAAGFVGIQEVKPATTGSPVVFGTPDATFRDHTG